MSDLISLKLYVLLAVLKFFAPWLITACGVLKAAEGAVALGNSGRVTRGLIWSAVSLIVGMTWLVLR